MQDDGAAHSPAVEFARLHAGLGTAALLEASEQVHVVSFDLAEQPWVAACAAYLQTRYPGRLCLVMGDSRETVARFAAEAGARFDPVLIDGGHDEATCRADVANTRASAGPGAVVVVDDLMPHEAVGVGATRAWEGLLRDGTPTSAEIRSAGPGATVAQADAGDSAGGCERRWGVARFGAG